ncbi:MAG TPA: hypothetical protein EYQ47_06805 [Cycloclasticus sp.]|nr:hypothetical protein [Cycloclasticus sp.]HIL93843.1 hypothetical protein [Cycloclasticus sp.]
MLDGVATPTFPINNQREITPWNQTIEKPFGYLGDDMIRTKKHWKPLTSTGVMGYLSKDNVVKRVNNPYISV